MPVLKIDKCHFFYDKFPYLYTKKKGHGYFKPSRHQHRLHFRR